LTEKYHIRFDSEETPEGETTQRWDSVELKSPTKTPDGFVRAQGFITRVGIFSYKTQDGKEVKELRPRNEVFSSSSLESFTLAPVTLDHPQINGRMTNLTPDTVAKFQVGSMSKPEPAGEFVKADFLITRKDAIEELMSGSMTQVSCGYDCQVVPRSGVLVHDDGREEHFDAIQTNIRGNHVALVREGRAGPSARIRIDEKNKEVEHMENEKIVVDGTEYEVPKAVADKLNSSDLQSRLDAQDVELEQLKGKLAALESEKSKLEEESNNQERLDDMKEKLSARLRLITKVAPILNKSPEDLLDLDELDLMRQVVQQEAPAVEIEGRSKDFIQGTFSHILSIGKVNTAAQINDAINSVRSDKAPEKDKIAEAYEGMIKRMTTAWNPQSREVK